MDLSVCRRKSYWLYSFHTSFGESPQVFASLLSLVSFCTSFLVFPHRLAKAFRPIQQLCQLIHVHDNLTIQISPNFSQSFRNGFCFFGIFQRIKNLLIGSCSPTVFFGVIHSRLCSLYLFFLTTIIGGNLLSCLNRQFPFHNPFLNIRGQIQ